jgi:cbb3-type cytochrome oxidase subunit 3
MKSLTDVVSGAGLSGYAEIALVIFLIAFIGVVISLFVPSKQRTYEHLRHLPIDADPVLQPLAPSTALGTGRDDRDSHFVRSDTDA